MSNKKDKSIIDVKSKDRILKQSESNNIDYFKYDVPIWDYIDRVDPIKIWNKM